MKKVIAIFAIALSLRLIGLNQSLWLDEAVTAVVVRDLSWTQIMTNFAPQDFHPTSYYLLMKLWTTFFGLSEISLRMPSILFSLGVGWLLYRLKGLWPAAFFLFNPLVIYYSQEARMYLMVTFLLTLAFYSLERKNAWLYCLAIILAFQTFYGAIFFIVGLMFYLLVIKNWRFLMLTFGSTLITVGMAMPLLWQQWHNSQEITALVVNWKNVLGTASLKNLLLIPLKFSIGRISFEPKAAYYLIAGLWTTMVWSRLKWRDPKAILLMTPLLLALVFSFVSPLLSYFRFLYLLPVLAILLNQGLKNNYLKIFILIGFIGFSLVYLLFPQFHREDWQSLARDLPEKTLVYGIVSSLEGINYYRPELLIKDLRFSALMAKQLLVVPYTAEIYGFDYQKRLIDLGYHQKRQQTYRQLVLETWVR
ncbi:hypothetical protein A2313_00545 [Candidatus Roizmanbacteria bacterium RIFOXYB2_FULL_41_10]|uniref:Glycosyltransferase RgtA/B/C/D-like domain-containing protein n=1 Tax=Candidatus Roizmanbacteria bacterium RIFOXYA1_FULL_41_12 TaxID=1802082 RepID=A0A1F7KAK4_9BACT|nr:MAG: hypothetical protein A2209_04175 [Candidatus Roizmanbacteria bacterium RIFOXYA1_FULL_41_12]OGK66869.1 MAG: hypothetical protein A2377_03150 [Candidatus Roizmanbacteria bacterium RIFOXYB1_FULL_41_27]OGK68875.1 MAG: hypothetical protein A2262_00620 [Candidatus Roizmanbacteria bacterium RIFOXYA2_FULL_41_8]OGK70757.1 MAG: hypothetical protein A2403_01555 [Candidatus Roizmanbacteria bacterium RIFOXYC1_FULL_41_16]OGK71451.1 MAG: hypothetical protein A2313_00545 [Candidatus Roizmanbacteria bac